MDCRPSELLTKIVDEGWGIVPLVQGRMVGNRDGEWFLRGEYMKKSLFAVIGLLAGFSAWAGFFGSDSAEMIGEVSTELKLLGPNHKVVVEAFDDPGVQGVACYVSRAKTGGPKAIVGLAEDTSDASVACRQVGTISFAKPIKQQEDVFAQSSSALFKKVRVVRMVDAKRNALIYLVYSDKLVDGSPKNAVTAVAVPSETKIPLR